jgi:hypothetical protein
MSQQAMDEVLRKMDEFPWIISYDNVNIPFRVFSQCVDNQSQLGHGTAAMVYIQRSAAPLLEGINQLLKEQRAKGVKKLLTAIEIMNLEAKSHA